MKDSWSRFTKAVLDFMFYSGILVILTLPYTMKVYGKYNPFFRTYYYPQLVIFTISGIFAVLIIAQLRKMFRTVLLDDCFVTENVVSLNKMGTYSFIIAGITSIRAFFVITPAICVVILVFVIAGLFSKVLSRVFDKAVSYKLENDLTI